MAVTAAYRVSGMTCQHCVAAVSDEISRLPGVAEVDVDLSSGTVTVTSDTLLARDAVATAVDEAGYDLTA